MLKRLGGKKPHGHNYQDFTLTVQYKNVTRKTFIYYIFISIVFTGNPIQ